MGPFKRHVPWIYGFIGAMKQVCECPVFITKFCIQVVLMKYCCAISTFDYTVNMQFLKYCFETFYNFLNVKCIPFRA